MLHAVVANDQLVFKGIIYTQNGKFYEKMAYGLIKRFWENKMSSPSVFARKPGTFFVMQVKFCATAGNRK